MGGGGNAYIRDVGEKWVNSDSDEVVCLLLLCMFVVLLLCDCLRMVYVCVCVCLFVWLVCIGCTNVFSDIPCKHSGDAAHCSGCTHNTCCCGIFASALNTRTRIMSVIVRSVAQQPLYRRRAQTFSTNIHISLSLTLSSPNKLHTSCAPAIVSIPKRICNLQ